MCDLSDGNSSKVLLSLENNTNHCPSTSVGLPSQAQAFSNDNADTPVLILHLPRSFVVSHQTYIGRETVGMPATSLNDFLGSTIDIYYRLRWRQLGLPWTYEALSIVSAVCWVLNCLDVSHGDDLFMRFDL